MYDVVTRYTNRPATTRKGMSYKAAMSFAARRIKTANVKAVMLFPAE